MSFIKLGELIEISRVENTESCIPQVSPEVLENFRKYANNLKKIAPKAEDFLYFSAIMMHAAEAAALNDDGTIKLTASGKPVEVGWDKTGGTWKWLTNDSSIKPYKNSNGDIFPEDELVRAHKKWKDKPLCIDHKSNSVDHVRGFIVDTYYDRALKRVVALCALDKAGFPQLARQVSTGMSNCVSMGTAVGKAICTEAGCHRVARTEADFCNHMRTKSGYGEINIELNPLELSIVVNGADPRANIKNIIASADRMNSYLETRDRELSKIASRYSATITKDNADVGSAVSDMNSIQVQGNDLAAFREDVERGLVELESLNSKISGKDTNDLAFNQSSGTVTMDETAVPNTNSGLAPPNDRYADNTQSVIELRKIAQSIESKLSTMKQSLDKLAKNSNLKEEETMSGSKEINKAGYYQGTEEPTPGQAKYPKDPLNEQLREHEDKHMTGQSPFPEVGPVDGMHPSPSSADPSGELERKKMLARAEYEEKAMKRNAIVNLAKQALENKRAYFNNGEGPNNPNTPTPGKVKYPIDKGHMAYEDNKNMVGQKPFPGVGSVDGLHPSPSSADVSDELKRKELLQRASLRARFVKAANEDGTQNLSKSAWEVFRGDELLLRASVNELSNGKVADLYSAIATREFGTNLISNVKVFGPDKVRSLVKGAQAAPAVPPAPAAPPAGDAGAMPPADAPVGGGEDTGKTGDPKESAVDLAEKARDVTSDLVEAVRALTGEQSEMGDAEGPAPEMGAAASSEMFSTANMGSLRRELNKELTHALKECIASLNDHQQELDMIAGMYDKGIGSDSNQEFVGSIVEDALNEAKAAIAKGFTLMTAFVKYARGTKAIVKRAEIEADLDALSEGDTMSTEHDSHSDSDLMSLINETNADLDDVKDMMVDDSDHMGDDELEPHDESLEGDLDVEGLGLADDNDAGPTVEVKPGQKLPEGLGDDATVKVMAGFNSLAARAVMRAKLAADATGKQDDGNVSDMSKQKFSDMLGEADGLANGQIKLEVKPSDNLGRFETLPEINKEMLELAKAPPNVRKEAESIHKMITSGALDPADLDALVAEGLDKDAVSYYKKYYGTVDGGSEFANELVKEHVKAELEKELNTFKLKMARAYELTYDMVDRGIVVNDRNVISANVDELMSFNETNFETLKKVVARHSPNMRKEAGRMPQVGMFGSGEANSAAVDDDWSQLSAAFSKTSKRMF